MSESHFTRNAGLAAGALFASSATLVCCVLPAVLVAIGAGAALAGLVTAFPQLIWLSEHKAIVFGIAAIALGVSGVALWVGRRAPCPADPALARSCQHLRRLSAVAYAVAVASFTLGASFAFIIPRLL
jgi:hypothetical protein